MGGLIGYSCNNRNFRDSNCCSYRSGLCSHVFDKVFNNVSKKHELENCSGQKCDECRLCYSFDKKVNIIVENTKEYVKRNNLRDENLSINSIN